MAVLQAQSQGDLIMTISGKSFPIGESDFETIIDEGKIYIDKTSYLKSLLTSAVEVFHFLRPHGFGKKTVPEDAGLLSGNEL